MPHVLLSAYLQLPMVLQDSWLVRHAQLHFLPIPIPYDLYESAVPPRPEILNSPLKSRVPAHYLPIFETQEALGERVVYVTFAILDRNYFP